MTACQLSFPPITGRTSRIAKRRYRFSKASCSLPLPAAWSIIRSIEKSAPPEWRAPTSSPPYPAPQESCRCRAVAQCSEELAEDHPASKASNGSQQGTIALKAILDAREAKRIPGHSLVGHDDRLAEPPFKFIHDLN